MELPRNAQKTRMGRNSRWHIELYRVTEAALIAARSNASTGLAARFVSKKTFRFVSTYQLGSTVHCGPVGAVFLLTPRRETHIFYPCGSKNVARCRLEIRACEIAVSRLRHMRAVVGAATENAWPAAWAIQRRHGSQNAWSVEQMKLRPRGFVPPANRGRRWQPQS